MLNTESIQNDCPPLQHHEWPPVAPFSRFSKDLHDFMEADLDSKQQLLTGLRGDHTRHGAFLHKCLSTIYAYSYGYIDSPVYLRSDPMLEIKLQTAKLILEEELNMQWVPTEPIPAINNQKDLVEYMRSFTTNNVGVYHEFWDYIRDEAGPQAMAEFLRLVLCRNEVVDDECALLVCGLQGNMKKAMVSNLWDECGNGSLTRFHTYWLRRLMEQTNDWEALPAYRAEDKKPWFSGILSNVFNVLLTRPGYKLQAYGFFCTTESWVEPHFVRILDGLARTGLDHEDIAVYFMAHVTIDPQHTQELLDAILYQTPALTRQEIDEILWGAHLAVAAATCQYREVMGYLRSIDDSNPVALAA
jgi:hypothetical protein